MLKVDRSNLRRAAEIAAQFAGSELADFARLRFDGQKLEIAACDGFKQVRLSLGGEFSGKNESAECIVPASRFLRAVQSLEGAEAKLTPNKSALRIEDENIHFNLAALDEDVVISLFPGEVAVFDGGPVSISSEAFLAGWRVCVPIVSNSKLMQELRAVALIVEDGKASFISVDGRQLHCYTINAQTAKESGVKLVFPADGWSAFRALISKAEIANLEMRWNKKYSAAEINFQAETLAGSAVFRLLDAGRYPNVSALLDSVAKEEIQTEFVVDSSEFASDLSRLTTVETKTSAVVRFSINPDGEYRAEMETAEVGSGSLRGKAIDVPKPGNAEISFDRWRLSNTVGALCTVSDLASIKISESTKPIIIIGDAGQDVFKGIVMPVIKTGE